jgi:hypothetical protein
MKESAKAGAVGSGPEEKGPANRPARSVPTVRPNESQESHFETPSAKSMKLNNKI